jgi:hypothetical protein
MTKTKKFAKFEELVETFFVKVQGSQAYKVSRNVKLAGPDGDRQIDVLLEGTIGTIEIRTIIECKDYSGKVNVQKIDELHSKMQDVKAHKAVLVSAKGFSKTAIQKAHRLGIEVCTMSEALSEAWHPQIDLPISIEEVEPSFKFGFQAYLEADMKIDLENLTINEINLAETFYRKWNETEFSLLPLKSDQIAAFIGLAQPFAIKDVEGKVIPIKNLEMELNFKRRLFFGNLSTLPNTLIMEKIIKNDRTVLVDAGHLLRYREFFAEYDESQSLPNEQAILYKCFSKPIIERSSFLKNFQVAKVK